MNSIKLWRTRVAYLIVTVGLWVAIAPLGDYPEAQRAIIGGAVIANVIFLFAVFTAPTEDAFNLGENVGKAIGYQAGFRDGLTRGTQLMDATGPSEGAEIIGLRNGNGENGDRVEAA